MTDRMTIDEARRLLATAWDHGVGQGEPQRLLALLDHLAARVEAGEAMARTLGGVQWCLWMPEADGVALHGGRAPSCPVCVGRKPDKAHADWAGFGHNDACSLRAALARWEGLSK